MLAPRPKSLEPRERYPWICVEVRGEPTWWRIPPPSRCASLQARLHDLVRAQEAARLAVADDPSQASRWHLAAATLSGAVLRECWADPALDLVVTREAGGHVDGDDPADALGRAALDDVCDHLGLRLADVVPLAMRLLGEMMSQSVPLPDLAIEYRDFSHRPPVSASS